MRKYLALSLVIFIVFLFLPAQALATDQLSPYTGGYLRGSVLTTNKTLLASNFQGTDASKIPSNKWLMSVLSVAGGAGTAPTGWVHQSVMSLHNDKVVYWVPQGYYVVEGGGSYYQSFNVGYGDYVVFYTRMDISSGKLVFKCYVYGSDLQYRQDTPGIYSWNYPSSDGNLLVGRTEYGGNWYKFFQFGVESNIEITETAWKVLNDRPCYYTGTQWKYLPGYSVRGSSAYISWKVLDGTYAYGKVGGLTYTGVNKDYVSNDRVCWKRTGTTIGNDVVLWSASGTVSDVVSKPYQ